MRSIAGLQNRPTWGTGQRKSLTRRTPSGAESAETTRQAHLAEQSADENRISRDSLQEDEETLALAKKGSLKRWKRQRPCVTCYSPCCSRWEWPPPLLRCWRDGTRTGGGSSPRSAIPTKN